MLACTPATRTSSCRRRPSGPPAVRSSAPRRRPTPREGRTALDILLPFLRRGDTLVITRIDRLARSFKDLQDLQDLVHELKSQGVTLRAAEQPVDTSTAAGKAFFDMLGVFGRVREDPAPRAVAGGDR